MNFKYKIMNEETKKLIESLKKAKPEDFNSMAKMKNNPEAFIGLILGNLRMDRFIFEEIQRKQMEGKELDDALDYWNKRKRSAISTLEELGHIYVEGEEKESKYDSWA
jgi:hypothetical protein